MGYEADGLWMREIRDEDDPLWSIAIHYVDCAYGKVLDDLDVDQIFISRESYLEEVRGVYKKLLKRAMIN